MAVTLHQLTCFLATMESLSFTRAADSLGLSQPALSEQVRLLESSTRTKLFVRLGRGVRPTEAGLALRPHALAALTAVDSGQRALGALGRLEEGTIRFGLFGAAHLYIAADLVSALAEEYPGLAVVLIGQNSADVIADIRRGSLEAGLVALPIADDSQLTVRPIAEDEVLYVSADEGRTRSPIGPAELASRPLVLSEATWGDRDFTRSQLMMAAQSVGCNLRAKVEVENVETALEIASRGVADTIAARGVLRSVGPNLPSALHSTQLDPSIVDRFAIVHRRDAPLSQPAQSVITLASRLMRAATSPIAQE